MKLSYGYKPYVPQLKLIENTIVSKKVLIDLILSLFEKTKSYYKLVDEFCIPLITMLYEVKLIRNLKKQWYILRKQNPIINW